MAWWDAITARSQTATLQAAFWGMEVSAAWWESITARSQTATLRPLFREQASMSAAWWDTTTAWFQTPTPAAAFREPIKSAAWWDRIGTAARSQTVMLQAALREPIMSAAWWDGIMIRIFLRRSGIRRRPGKARVSDLLREAGRSRSMAGPRPRCRRKAPLPITAGILLIYGELMKGLVILIYYASQTLMPMASTIAWTIACQPPIPVRPILMAMASAMLVTTVPMLPIPAKPILMAMASATLVTHVQTIRTMTQMVMVYVVMWIYVPASMTT